MATEQMIVVANGRGFGDTIVDWLAASVILVCAGLLRAAFFSGGLGTDEIVYISQAYHLLDGDLARSSYIGAIRYGINGFQALSFRLFGSGVAGAAGLFFACSLGNILLTYWFARNLWGRQAAIWAAVTLAVLPIDVALAGSLNPDPYLGLFITASIIMFYFAEQEDRRILYFLAGLLAGWVFWIKEEVIIFSLVFILLAWSNRPWRAGWLWFAFGGIICVAADLLVFWSIYGDPFYQYRTARKNLGDWLATRPVGDMSLWAYPRYLLVNIYHTGILGWLALAAGVSMLRQQVESRHRFVLIWAGGLLIILSTLPVSFSPIAFIRKQANYMEIFLVSLALLAGWFLARQRRSVALVLGGAMVVSGIVFSALEQQVVQVVTINGRAAAAFAEAHAPTPVFGPLTAQRQSILARLLREPLANNHDIRPVAELREVPLDGSAANDIDAYLIKDPQMRNWPGARTEAPLPRQLQECLRPDGRLDPGRLGLGRSVVAALRSFASLLPDPFSRAVTGATDPFWRSTRRRCMRSLENVCRWGSLDPREHRSRSHEDA